MLDKINTDRIREVMTGLEDLAVIRGDENPLLDMVGGYYFCEEEVVDKTLEGEKLVCFGCWLDFLLAEYNKHSYLFLRGSGCFAKYIGVNPLNMLDESVWASNELSALIKRVPELWGNGYGGMYNHSEWAYLPAGCELWRPVRLRDVTSHWRKFADRLDELRRGR